MVSCAPGASAVCLALTFVILSTSALANADNCQSQEVTAVHGKGRCLLQGARAQSKVNIHEHQGPFEGLKETPTWTTNIGQEHHNCNGSRFEVDFNGTRSGMPVTDGMRLKKGECPLTPNNTKPVLTQDLTCVPEETGCHMWCAPVWHSDYDTQDWSGLGARCSNWDRTFNSADPICAKTSRLFTWARADVPSTKNELDLTFAIPHDCTSWGSPLWVTIYDPLNWAKSFRWCFNRKGDWGACDYSEDVPLSKWHDRNFKFSSFMEKHGYAANDYVLELAVYAEFDSLEVLVNNLNLKHVQELTTTSAAPPSLFVESGPPCGSKGNCGIDHQCCRKDNSTVDARCCPRNWKCCEDSCCPEYYTCSIANGGHTCSPPDRDIINNKPLVCQI